MVITETTETDALPSLPSPLAATPTQAVAWRVTHGWAVPKPGAHPRGRGGRGAVGALDGRRRRRGRHDRGDHRRRDRGVLLVPGPLTDPPPAVRSTTPRQYTRSTDWKART